MMIKHRLWLKHNMPWCCIIFSWIPQMKFSCNDASRSHCSYSSNFSYLRFLAIFSLAWSERSCFCHRSVLFMRWRRDSYYFNVSSPLKLHIVQSKGIRALCMNKCEIKLILGYLYSYWRILSQIYHQSEMISWLYSLPWP